MGRWGDNSQTVGVKTVLTPMEDKVELKAIVKSILDKNEQLRNLYRTYPGATWVGTTYQLRHNYTLLEGVVERSGKGVITPATDFAVVKTKSRIIILER